MPTKTEYSLRLQIVAWTVASLFILGFFFKPVGEWTGPIGAVWFVGTQKPWRGFLWLMAISFVPHLVGDWRILFGASPEQALQHAGWILLATVLAVLSLTFHRLTSPRLPGLLSTLPFPLAAASVQMLFLSFLPQAAAGGSLAVLILVDWFAAGVVWMWNKEFRAAKTGWAGALFGALFALVVTLRHTLMIDPRFGWLAVGGAVVLAVWALLNRTKKKSWAERPETVALLQSPYTGKPLHVDVEQGGEVLVSSSGERFPVRGGIPTFLKQEDLSGDNLKYNHLYETIGGFYDDIQRIFCALKGFHRDAYFVSYMRQLEVKPGDSVLETSVGTGLNFKYLPGGVKLSGLDLSPEMLVNCQSNLRRWHLDCDLYLGNAESQPFADASFDVVFHVGGINFFNDRAKAIREMIRVAKPGSLLLIADETEKHVKAVYEKQPGGLFKNRKAPVSAPVDLVPAEMQDIHLEELRDGQFYVLTFRKP
ncbi:MAG TPA: class I SAM-dependent methyltransferase [Bryobacteraceae bacterium]|nr:class I SAM-dependent methyltransferase [Bryobacteraceae bacterium]